MAKTNIQQIVAKATNERNEEYKELIIAFVITEEELDDGGSAIQAYPLAVKYEGNVGDFLDIPKFEKVIKIIPAPEGSYSVYEIDSHGNHHHLGYKYPGAYF